MIPNEYEKTNPRLYDYVKTVILGEDLPEEKVEQLSNFLKRNAKVREENNKTKKIEPDVTRIGGEIEIDMKDRMYKETVFPIFIKIKNFDACKKVEDDESNIKALIEENPFQNPFKDAKPTFISKNHNVMQLMFNKIVFGYMEDWTRPAGTSFLIRFDRNEIEQVKEFYKKVFGNE